MNVMPDDPQPWGARAVHSYCLWRTADALAAEDATATVFFEAWRKRRRLILNTDSATRRAERRHRHADCIEANSVM